MIWILLFTSAALFDLSHSTPATDSTEGYSVPDHFKDIISLIPKDLIKNITYEHLKTDEGFKSAVKYMQSDEWKDRVQTIKEKSEWVALKKYMKDIGINIDIFIKCAEGFLQNVTLTLDQGHPPAKKSVKAFLVDVEKNLPTTKILTAVHDKVIKNPKLKNMFDKISSTETRKLIDNVLAIPEIKKMMRDFADMDMNLTDVLSLVYMIMGWGELKIDV